MKVLHDICPDSQALHQAINASASGAQKGALAASGLEEAKPLRESGLKRPHHYRV